MQLGHRAVVQVAAGRQQVVDDHHVGIRDVVRQTVEQLRDVVGFVVGGDDNEGAHHGIAPKTA